MWKKTQFFFQMPTSTWTFLERDEGPGSGPQNIASMGRAISDTRGTGTVNKLWCSPKTWAPAAAEPPNLCCVLPPASQAFSHCYDAARSGVAALQPRGIGLPFSPLCSPTHHHHPLCRQGPEQGAASRHPIAQRVSYNGSRKVHGTGKQQSPRTSWQELTCPVLDQLPSGPCCWH